MLSVNKYTQGYVDRCRSRVAEDVSAYQGLVAAARKQSATSEPPLSSAVEAFEQRFFSNMVQALDGCFVHRTRAIEGKDGNPLNEVRMLCNSMVNNKNIMCADKTIRFDPTKSVLKYRIGHEIKLNEAEFTHLSKAFFAEIERKYL
jgi:hypothetical protein